MNEKLRKKLPLLVIPIAGLMAIGIIYYALASDNEDLDNDDRKSIAVGVINANDTIAVANSKIMAYDQELIARDIKKKKSDNFTFMFDDSVQEDESNENSKSFLDSFQSNESIESKTEPIVEEPRKKPTSVGTSKRQQELAQFNTPETNIDTEPINQDKRRRRDGDSFYDGGTTKSASTEPIQNSGQSSYSSALSSLNNRSSSPSGKLYKANFFNDQEINPNGTQVSIRVNEDILLKNGQNIKANSIIYGTTNVSNNRMNIKVSGINLNGNLIQANLVMVTDEGVQGFPLQEQPEGVDVNRIMQRGNNISNAARTVGLGNFNIPFFMGGGKKRNQKVFIPDGFNFYLIEE